MVILHITFTDSEEYTYALGTDEALNLTVAVNRTDVGKDQSEDYLCIKCGTIPLLIAPMRTVLKYECIPIDNTASMDKIKEWRDAHHATND